MKRIALIVVILGTPHCSASGASDTTPDEHIASAREPLFASGCALLTTQAEIVIARKRATATLKYMIGAPATVLDFDAKLKDSRLYGSAGKATRLRTEFTRETPMYTSSSGAFTVVKGITNQVGDVVQLDTRPRAIFYIQGTTQQNHDVLRTRVNDLGNAVNAVFGQTEGPCMNDYLLNDGGKDVSGDLVAGIQPFAFDPEPATLTANLGSAQGVTAASVTPAGVAEVAIRWPSTYAYVTGYKVQGGQPCSTVAQSSGATLTARIATTVSSSGTVRAKCNPTTP